MAESPHKDRCPKESVFDDKSVYIMICFSKNTSWNFPQERRHPSSPRRSSVGLAAMKSFLK